jgi:hypothetical protein
MRNPAVTVHLSDERVTGVLSLCHRNNGAVARAATQTPPPDIGIDCFEFWLPGRRPDGKNFALAVEPALDLFGPENALNGITRPTVQPNAWVADPADPLPTLTLSWRLPQTIGRIVLGFDTDFDHPMESVLLHHPERQGPFCVQQYRVRDGSGRVLAEVCDNHQTRNTIRFDEPVTTNVLAVEILKTGGAPAAIFEVRCYP